MKWLKQKGQAIVEFALAFPFFVMFLFGIIYGGMFFADYVKLNDIARSVARAAVLNEITDDGTETHTYNDDGKSLLLLNGWYDFGKGTNGGNISVGESTIKISPIAYKLNTSEDTATVTIEAKRQTKSKLLEIILPETYTIEYSMYK